MPRQPSELEKLLAQMVEEHKGLLADVEAHHRATRSLDVAAMERLGARQDAARARITLLDGRRKLLTQIDARTLKLSPDATLAQIAAAVSASDPARAQALLALRDQLRTLATQIAEKNHIAARVTGALLGHLNTAVRLISSTVNHAGTYTPRGTPRVSPRIGVMEAVA